MGILSSATAAKTSYNEGNRLCSHTDSGDRPSGQGRPCRGQKGPQGDSQGLVRHHHWWRGCWKNRDWPFWENSPKDCREFRRAYQEARGRGLQREQVPQGHQRFHASGWRLHTWSLARWSRAWMWCERWRRTRLMEGISPTRMLLLSTAEERRLQSHLQSQRRMPQSDPHKTVCEPFALVQEMGEL